MTSRRNHSSNHESFVIVMKDGTRKVCKSRYSYRRWCANNDTALVKYVKRLKGKSS